MTAMPTGAVADARFRHPRGTIRPFDIARPQLLSLRFPRQIEEQYLWDRTDAFVPVLRFCVFFTAAVYFLYMGGDLWLFRRFNQPLIYGLLLGVAAPAALLGIAVTYTRYRDRWVQLAISLAALINGACLIAICVLGPSRNAPIPYSCLIMFMFVCYFLLGMSHHRATPMALITAISYLAGAWGEGVPVATLYDQGSMLGVGLVVGAIGSRVMELSSRRDWLSDHRLRELAERDALTGLLNQQTFFRRADALLKSPELRDRSVCFMVVGLEHLASYNHHLGHQAVDECLRRVGACLAERLPRAEDLVGRLGGEQFVLMLHDYPSDRAAAFAGDLRRAVRNLQVPHPGAPQGYASVLSGEVCATAGNFQDALDAAHQAGAALHLAHDEGNWRERAAVAAE